MNVLTTFQVREGWDQWSFGLILGGYVKRHTSDPVDDLPEKIQNVYDQIEKLPEFLSLPFRTLLTLDLCRLVDLYSIDNPDGFSAYLGKVVDQMRLVETVRHVRHEIAPARWAEMLMFISMAGPIGDMAVVARLCETLLDLGDGAKLVMWIENALPRPKARIALMMDQQTLTVVDLVVGELTTLRRGDVVYVIEVVPGKE